MNFRSGQNPVPFHDTHNIDSFFSASHHPYYIFAPNYRQNSAGIRCLHYLCHYLNEAGYEAYITPATVVSPWLRTPLLTKEIAFRHIYSQRQPIAVYPEVVSGNPLNASTVARWLLNIPGHISGDSHFSPSELLFYFSPWVLPKGVDAKLLRMPMVDTRIFNNLNNSDDLNRHGCCYYANKYLGFGGTIDPWLLNEGISLCQDIPRTHEEIASILRKSRTLYSYEQTALMQEALSCGCEVIIVTTDYWNKTQWETRAYGARLDSETHLIEQARQEIAHYREHIEEEQVRAHHQIRDFVDITQRAAHREMETRPVGRALQPTVIADLRNILTRFPSMAGTTATIHSFDRIRMPEYALTTAETQALTTYAESLPDEIFEFFIVDSDAPLERILDTIQSIISPTCGTVLVTVFSTHARPPSLEHRCVRWIPSDTRDSAVTLEALRNSPATWSTFIKADQRLAPHAVATLRCTLSGNPEILTITTGELRITGDDDIGEPRISGSPPDSLGAGIVPNGLLLSRRELWLAAGGWSSLPANMDKLDAALRLSAFGPITHIPGLLVHHHIPASAIVFRDEMIAPLREAIISHNLSRSGSQATVQKGLFPELVRTVLPEAGRLPKISLIVATRDNAEGLETLVQSLIDKTDYPDWELIVIDNGTIEPAARSYLDNLSLAAPGLIHVQTNPSPFNAAGINNAAVTQASGELLVFLHDDVQALHAGWLHEMATHCLQPGVGIVGARLLDRDGNIQEAGIVPLQTGLAAPLFSKHPGNQLDPDGLLGTVRRVSAISGACMMVRRDVYLAVGGMDAQHFPLRVADIDFCLKVRASGQNIIWTPYASLLHDSDGTTSGNIHDNNALLARWGKHFFDEPHFNPALAIDKSDLSPEYEPAFAYDSLHCLPIPKVFCVAPQSPSWIGERMSAPLREAAAQCQVRARFWPTIPAAVVLKRLGIQTVLCESPGNERELRSLISATALANCRVVMDIDNLIASTPHALRARIDQLRPFVHCFTTSSPRLATELVEFSEQIRLVHTSIPDSIWGSLQSDRRQGAKLRIGWHNRYGEFAQIESAVLELADTVDWIFLGECTPHCKVAAKEIYDFPNYSDFPLRLASLDLDLAILPITNSPTSDYLLPQAILEYGILGIPVIAPSLDSIPITMPVIRTDATPAGWVSAIHAAIGNRKMLEASGDQLRNHVREHWLSSHRLDTLLAVFAC